MKTGKKFFAVGSVMLALVLILSACGGKADNNASSGSSNSKVIEISVNNTSTSTGSFATGIFEPWKKLVEEKTEGRVKVNLYHGGALGGSASVLKDVKGGMYDVGIVWSPYEVDSEFFPVTIGDLPFAATPDVQKNTEIIQEYVQEFLEDMNKEVIVMGVTGAQSAYFVSKEPITKFEDFKNKKVRAVGKNEAETIKAWGAVPVSAAVEELYDAMQKGIVDIINTSAGMAVDTYIYEVAPYLLDVPYKSIQMLPIMNKDTFESLPDDLKTLFEEELNPALVQLVVETNIIDAQQAKDNFAKAVEGKGGLMQMPAEEVNKMKSNVQPVWEEWVKNADKKGYKGEEMLAKYKDVLAIAGVEFPY